MQTTVTPQLTIIFLWLFGLGMALAMDGKPLKGNFSFLRALWNVCFSAGMLYWGGFFTPLIERLSR